MKLVKTNGEAVIEGKNVQIVAGIDPGQMVKVSEIIQPTADNPMGMVIVDRDKSGWRQYYPFVIGAHFIDDDGIPYTGFEPRENSTASKDEILEIAVCMAQELQDLVDEAEQPDGENPLSGASQLLDEWDEVYKRSWQMMPVAGVAA
jgi:hypothetical protein